MSGGYRTLTRCSRPCARPPLRVRRRALALGQIALGCARGLLGARRNLRSIAAGGEGEVRHSVRRVTWLFAGRVVGWQAGGMGAIYEVLFGALVLQSRRDRLLFGEAEQQARATDSSDG